MLTDERLTIRFLGTGTSQGVPVIGCRCVVCRSANPRDQRLRTALLVSKGDVNIAVDAGPDFRQQMLRAGVEHLQAVLLTHEHNDHIIGLDDVRPFNFRSGHDMHLYATERVQQQLKVRFAYAFDETPYPGAPRFDLQTIHAAEPFHIGGIPVLPVEVLHGNLPVLGFRFGDFTYITDAKSIPPSELDKVKGTRILVLNALHHAEHHAHLNLKEALALADLLQPEQTYLTHISHNMGLYDAVSEQLPPSVHLAYDDLELTV